MKIQVSVFKHRFLKGRLEAWNLVLLLAAICVSYWSQKILIRQRDVVLVALRPNMQNSKHHS